MNAVEIERVTKSLGETVAVDNLDLEVPQGSIYGELKSGKNLGQQIDFWLGRLDLREAAHKKVEALSKGMSQRVQFIAAVVFQPELLILDEPFSPMLLLLRMSLPGGVPAWQPWLGLVGVLATTLLTVWAGGRIFRVGILMQGKAPKLHEVLRWVWRG